MVKYIRIKGIIWFLLLFFILGSSKSIASELPLNQEEITYISNRKPIKAASIDGAAPLHYINSEGNITGIAVTILDKIGEITGLKFEYELYKTIDQAFESEADILFGLTPTYAPEDMVLSDPYLKSKTILYMNSSLDPNKLDDKIYAHIKGGKIPKGIKEKNISCYNSREETLKAIEKGKADYSYGNEYSITFYLLKNGYENIMMIPKAIDFREYSIGYLIEDKTLSSIINQSIKTIDEDQINQLILDATLEMERRLTFPMVMDAYGGTIIIASVFIISLLLWGIHSNIKDQKDLSFKIKRYELLSRISDEYLFEYIVETDNLKLHENFFELIGRRENFDEIVKTIKKAILEDSSDEEAKIIKIALNNEEYILFKVIKLNIYSEKGKIYYISGKLIDVSCEVAEKEKLIIESQRDGLTGLYNSITTEKFIRKSISKKKNKEVHALILIDCDKFKNINDTYGHLEGDRALKNVSLALQRNFRKTDIIGRIGGDEFCVYMEDVPSAKFVQLKCEEVIKEVKEMDQKINLSLSIGVKISKDKSPHDVLFANADHALYEAKNMGGGKVFLFESLEERK